MAKRRIVLVDIDGTISDASDRAAKYLGECKKDWDGFYNACGEDKPIKPIIEVVEVLSTNFEIVYCTGRRESCREDTIKWLDENIKLFGNIRRCHDILFRKDGDKRHDTVVKPRMLDEYLKCNPDTEVAVILEDRNSMVKKWRELGYTCLQVAEGDF